jgi:hypothetical protein
MMDRLRSEEAGVVYVLMVLAILVIMAMAAFTIDIGWIFVNKSRAQRASDSAALAGVTALPAEPVVAIDRAREFARINGYDNSLADVVVTPIPTADNELRVEIDDEIDTFFMKVFGIDTVDIHVSSKARYISSVPLGNPDNIFGPDPDASPAEHQAFADIGFWPAITFQYDAKYNGDAYATRCGTSYNNSGTACGGGIPNAEWYGTTHGEPDGYWYGVEVPSGASNLKVEVYDAGYGQGGEAVNDQVYPREDNSFYAPSQFEVQEVVIQNAAPGLGTYTITFNSQPTQSIPVAANNGLFLENELEALSSLNAVTITSSNESPALGNFAYRFRVDSPPLIDFPLATCDGSGLVAQDPLLPVTCVVNPISDGGGTVFAASTTFRLYGPDDTPFDIRDNTPVPGCQIDGTNELGPGTNYEWTELCFLGNPTPGLYPLRIFAGPGVTWNEFSLKATADGAPVRLFALEDLSIASRIQAGQTNFYLAEVDTDYRGLNFIVELYDGGDVSGGTGASSISIVGPTAPGDPPVIWARGCRIDVDRNSIGAPTYDDHVATIADGSDCTLDTTRPGPGGPDGYQADWVRFIIPLPGDYSCPNDSSGNPFCWWGVQYDYPTKAQERTTWKASVEGQQVALVFDDGP